MSTVSRLRALADDFASRYLDAYQCDDAVFDEATVSKLLIEFHAAAAPVAPDLRNILGVSIG